MTRISHKPLTPKRLLMGGLGILAILRGTGYIWPDGIPDGLQTLSHVPGGLVTWGWVWVITGLVCLIGVTRRHSWPLIPFAVVNLLWAGSYLIEWVAVTLLDPGDEISRDWLTALSYLAQGIAALTIVRLVDPGEVEAARGEL